MENFNISQNSYYFYSILGNLDNTIIVHVILKGQTVFQNKVWVRKNKYGKW